VAPSVVTRLDGGARIAPMNRMGGDVVKADVCEVLERHHARYEVRPYYELFDLRPVGVPEITKRVQAGFDVDLYANLIENENLPLDHSESARMVVAYFEQVAKEVQSRIGQQCTVQVITNDDSLVLDSRHHFRPEAMLRIRIGHCRGLDQPEGPPEEQALEAIRQTLREMNVREASE
jgi:hypothetical protein